MPDVFLVSTGIALPPHEISQDAAAEVAFSAFASRFPDFERLSKVFKSSGIKTRYAARPLEWYLQPHGWPERNEAYIEVASDLFVEAAGKALDRAGLEASAVDTVVTISSTGIATPSLEARVSSRMGFRPDVQRVPVFGLGCAGGVSGLSLAARLAGSGSGHTVLLVAAELCTLSFRLDKLSKANIVATALFGDGAAACVLRPGANEGLRVEASGEYTWPDTLDIMGWSIDQEGLGVIFDRSIPPFAEANMASAIDNILARAGVSQADIDQFLFHPGGTKVIEALERALNLGDMSLSHERSVLADFGNMSAPTAIFVLERALAAGLSGRTLLSAMGPGFTASSIMLRAAS
ncbi:type III polyketide synthase [Tianweitania sp. BSSL-BM11]|uniref:Type III polyketide synthase n=1 Tax=Tianweitania aestuarii TaxID=2814886 RepID=A0ABS5RRE0_9HYPH|nr:type III polyketide synthase [Tianweitania aestuarii]MBS9719576.1 type III polyketide synthase [Tianweitania aestuarii]